jgi:phosphoglycolate phosphatase-like HAD superfamily hydrolase
MSEPTSTRIEILHVGDTPSDAKAARDCNVRIAAWGPTVNLGELEETPSDFMFSPGLRLFRFLRRTD